MAGYQISKKGVKEIMKINSKRLKNRMDQINSISVTEEGGMMRLALSDADKEARNLLKQWMIDAGMEVRIDDMGSMYGVLKGTDSDALPICFGSHMDTQPNGGKYDGFYGVMSALEAVCTFRDNNVDNKHPLMVINWTNEEGARFTPPMLASGVVAGKFDGEWVHNLKDQDGVSFLNELKRIGYLGKKENRLEKAKAYIELHIEQGPVLESEGCSLGIVNAALGITGIDIIITGEANHAGPTPMSTRKDALMAAAEIMLEIKEYVTSYGDPAVATIGTISIHPASKNVIPGIAKFSIDIRYHTPEGLTEIENSVINIVEKVCERNGTKGDVQRYWRAEPVYYDGTVITAITNAVKKIGCPSKVLTSGAGHDAVFISDIIPTGMLFVPSIGGKSHCPQEETDWEDLVNGTQACVEIIKELDV